MACYNEVSHPKPCEWQQNCLLVFDMVYLLFTKASTAFKFGSGGPTLGNLGVHYCEGQPVQHGVLLRHIFIKLLFC